MEVSFDVEKTNSTISPYIATIQISGKMCPRVKFGYAYQDNRWVLKSLDWYSFDFKKPQDLALHECFTP
jgi:hypothetical protein